MAASLTQFWSDVRQELQRDYGQQTGRRDRGRTLKRQRLAQQLGLSSRTLKGFLNGNQKRLGRDALMALFSSNPEIEARYRQASGHREKLPSAEDQVSDWISAAGAEVQLSLSFEGFGGGEGSITTRLEPGKARVLTVTIEAKRLA